jgi:hypothetical protein
MQLFYENNREHLGKFKPKVDQAIFLGYSLNKVAYRVLNRRTRVIKESFDVSFDDYYLHLIQNKVDVTFILESDIPEGQGPVNIIEFDYESMLGPRDTTLDFDRFLAQQQIAL